MKWNKEFDHLLLPDRDSCTQHHHHHHHHHDHHDHAHLDSLPLPTETLAHEQHVGEEEAVHVELASAALPHLELG